MQLFVLAILKSYIYVDFYEIVDECSKTHWAMFSGVRRKFSWGGFHSLTYGGHFYLVNAVCDVTI